MNKVPMNIKMKVFVWIFVLIFLGQYLEVEFLGHMVSVFLCLYETVQQFSKVFATFYIP
jgi:hypothetical protein